MVRDGDSQTVDGPRVGGGIETPAVSDTAWLNQAQLHSASAPLQAKRCWLVRPEWEEKVQRDMEARFCFYFLFHLWKFHLWNLYIQYILVISTFCPSFQSLVPLILLPPDFIPSFPFSLYKPLSPVVVALMNGCSVIHWEHKQSSDAHPSKKVILPPTATINC